MSGIGDAIDVAKVIERLLNSKPDLIVPMIAEAQSALADLALATRHASNALDRLKAVYVQIQISRGNPP